MIPEVPVKSFFQYSCLSSLLNPSHFPPQQAAHSAGPTQKSSHGPPLAIFFRFFCFPKRCWKNASKKHRKKYENPGFWPPRALPKPSPKPFQIDVPKNMRSLINFGLIFLACCKSRTSKFVRPASVLLTFHTIQLFAFGMHFLSKKRPKNLPKTRSDPLKNRCQQRCFFQHRFFKVSASILEGLGPPTWSQVGS